MHEKEEDYKIATSERKSSSVEERKSSKKNDDDTKDKDDNQHELVSEDGKVISYHLNTGYSIIGQQTIK